MQDGRILRPGAVANGNADVLARSLLEAARQILRLEESSPDRWRTDVVQSN